MQPSSASRNRRAAASGLLLAHLAGGLAFAAAACELTEVTLAEPRDVIVAEVLIQATDTGVVASALLYATQGSQAPDRVRTARVWLTPEGEGAVELPRVNPAVCLDFRPREPVTPGACFASRTALAHLGPGRLVDLRITLPDGAEIRGSTRTVGAFDLAGAWGGPSGEGTGSGPDGDAADDAPVCYLTPETTLELTWTQAEGAWAYLIEAWIRGLPEALAAYGIEMNQDPFFLVGVSLSASDTTVVFPSQIGLAERVDGHSEVLLALQGGLPAGAEATVHVAAADRNFVRWIRGASFNLAAPARISSLDGDGFGYFGSTAVRTVAVTTRPSEATPPCGSG